MRLIKNAYIPNVYCSLAFFAGMVVALSLHFVLLRHHDLGWHLAAGGLIRSQGIPLTDPWSFTSNGRHWMNISWLWDTGASWLFQQGGFALLSAITIILAGGVNVLAYRLCRNIGVHAPLALLGSTTALIALMTYQHPTDYVITVAPQALAPIFVLLYMSLLCSMRRLWLLPICMLLWVNLHGSYMLGLLLIGYFAAFACMQKQWRNVKLLLVFGTLTALAVFANPLGIHIIEAALRSIQGHAAHSITEWQPFAFGANPLASAYLILFFLTVPAQYGRAPKAWWFLSMIFLILGLSQIRHYVFFILISLPLVLLGIQRWLEENPIVAAHMPAIVEWNHVKAPDAARKPAALLAITAALIFCFSPLLARFLPATNHWPATYPETEIDYLLHHHSGERIYNHWNLGGYLIAGLKGQSKILIDGRAETAYPPEIISLYNSIGNEQQLIDRYDLKVAIMPNYLPSDMVFFNVHPAWRKAFVGNAATIYERK